MQTDKAAHAAHHEIAQALAILDKTNRHRLGASRAFPNPKIKPLVLRAMPSAKVRRNASSQAYECFIGDERIGGRGCSDSHSTPDKAWACLARHIVGVAT